MRKIESVGMEQRRACRIENSTEGKKRRKKETVGISEKQKSDLRRASSSDRFDATPWRRVRKAPVLLGETRLVSSRSDGGSVIGGATEKKVIPRRELMRVGALLDFLCILPLFPLWRSDISALTFPGQAHSRKMKLFIRS